MRHLTRFALVPLLVLAGCPGSSSGPCPDDVPSAGDPCPPPDPQAHACEYGGNARTECTTFVDCAIPRSGQPLQWIVVDPRPGCGANDASCPKTSAEVVDGSPCAPGLTCSYDDAVCGCLSCVGDGGMGGFMHCRKRTDVARGCPVARPRLGTPCTTGGLDCDYTQCCGGPSLGTSMSCTGGFWRNFAQGGVCSCVQLRCP